MDIEENKKLLEIVVNRVTEQLGDPKLNASKLISALAGLTQHDVNEPDIGWENAKYHATRLAIELGNAKNDSDKDRRYINRIWKDVVEAYEIIEPSIENDVRKQGYRQILKPKKTDPKTGRVEFYLDVEELDEDRFSETKELYTKDGKRIIHYEKISNPKPSLIGRLFANIVLDKPRHFLYRLLPIALLLVAYLWFEWILWDDDIVDVTAFVLFVFYACCAVYVFRAFYQITDRWIVKAPIWMTSLFENDSAQVEIRDSGRRDKKGEKLFSISLTVYQSTCLVCDSPVVVDKGEGEFKHRLIGKCIHSPVEHIYSFDHVTRKGVPLRSDTYLG